jgi:hypothetical protein
VPAAKEPVRELYHLTHVTRDTVLLDRWNSGVVTWFHFLPTGSSLLIPLTNLRIPLGHAGGGHSMRAPSSLSLLSYVVRLLEAQERNACLQSAQGRGEHVLVARSRRGLGWDSTGVCRGRRQVVAEEGNLVVECLSAEHTGPSHKGVATSACNQGYYYPTDAAVPSACRPCPPGTWSRGPPSLPGMAGEHACINCSAGTASAAVAAASASACVPCAPGTYSLSGAALCTACAAGAVSEEGSATCSRDTALLSASARLTYSSEEELEEVVQRIRGEIAQALDVPVSSVAFGDEL